MLEHGASAPLADQPVELLLLPLTRGIRQRLRQRQGDGGVGQVAQGRDGLADVIGEGIEGRDDGGVDALGPGQGIASGFLEDAQLNVVRGLLQIGQGPLGRCVGQTDGQNIQGKGQVAHALGDAGELGRVGAL